MGFWVQSILIGILMIKYRLLHSLGVREVVYGLITLVLFGFMAEGGVRGYFYLIEKSSVRGGNISRYLGWDTKANIQINADKNMKRGYGRITYSTQKYGFRIFGDVYTRKKKILIIGDSTTEANTVSDGKTYYEYLKQNHDGIEIFAHGCGGYGSLQEYMIMDKYIDIIKPHLILWQYCSNDIVNNDHELESLSFINNNHMRRPYYKDGKIEWLYPAQNHGWIWNLVEYSYVLRIVNIRLNILRAETGQSIEYKLSPDSPALKQAIETTFQIMNLVQKRAGDIPVVAFSVDDPKWINKCFYDISRRCGIHFICGIPDAIENARRTGMVVDGRPYDEHHNWVGHSIIGNLILKYILETGILDGRGEGSLAKERGN